jgi:hypothetical protein
VKVREAGRIGPIRFGIAGRELTTGGDGARGRDPSDGRSEVVSDARPRDGRVLEG